MKIPMQTPLFRSLRASNSLRYPLLMGSVLLASSLVFSGCQGTPAPEPSAVANTARRPAPTSNVALQQQVQSDPNVAPDKKQQILDSLKASQQADNDPRALRGRPTKAAH